MAALPQNLDTERHPNPFAISFPMALDMADDGDRTITSRERCHRSDDDTDPTDEEQPATHGGDQRT